MGALFGGDPDLNAAILASQRLERRQLERHDETLAFYQGSPFEWIVRLPGIKRRGQAMEEIVAETCSGHFQVTKTPDVAFDRLLGDFAVEFKCATLAVSGTSRKLTFNQIRLEQDYHYVLFTGLLPLSVVSWCVPKDELLRWREQGRIRPQHGGRDGTDTYFLIVDSDLVPEWLDPWGGSFDDAMAVVKNGCALAKTPHRRQLLLLEP